MKNIITILFSFCFIFTSVQANELYQATAGLNIREGVGGKYKIVGSIEKGDKVIIDTIIDGWGRILKDDKGIGYASMKYLTNDIKDYSSSNNDKNNNDTIFKIGFWIIIILIGIAKYSKSGSSNKKSTAPMKSVIETRNFYCENCGVKKTNLKELLNYSCIENNNGKGKHILYQGTEKSEYLCKWCGSKHSNLRVLCSYSCINSPVGKHRPAL